MGVIFEQYKQAFSNADGEDYSNAGGCGVAHPFDDKKRKSCEKAHSDKLKIKQGSDQGSLDVQKQQNELLKIKLQNDEKQSQRDANKKQMTPLQIVGIVGGSLMAITIMVVVIKLVKNKKNK